MQVETVKSSPSNIAKALKQEANTNKPFADVCTVFAMRERTRSQVTVNNLQVVMESNKFNLDKNQCRQILEIFAKIGIGRLIKDSKGQTRALVDIKQTLQSIGLTAMGDTLNLKPFRPQAKYTELLPEPQKRAPDMKQERRKVERRTPTELNPNMKLSGVVGDKYLDIPLTPEEFQDFLMNILTRKSAK